MSLDPTFVKAMAKLDDGFALADRIVAAARGGPERPELNDMIEECGNDSNLAIAVITRLVSHVTETTPEQMAAAMAGAGIPPPLGSAEKKTAGGIHLP